MVQSKSGDLLKRLRDVEEGNLRIMDGIRT